MEKRSALARLRIQLRKVAGLPPLPEEQMGAAPDPIDPRDFVRDEVDLSGAAPVFSLREYGIERAYDQGRTQSCVGHSGAAFVHSLFNRVTGPLAWRPSPFWLYYMARAESNLQGVDGGAYIRDLMKALSEHGCSPMSAHPSTDPRAVPNAASIARAAAIRIRNYQRVLVGAEAPSVMMTALESEKLPIIVGIRLFDGVNDPRTKFTGAIELPEHGERFIGGHAMLVDGYDWTREVFFGWNSWGGSWGASGRFTLPFAYLTKPSLTQDIWTADYRYW